jgi:HK97 family phage major capsid protein
MKKSLFVALAVAVAVAAIAVAVPEAQAMLASTAHSVLPATPVLCAMAAAAVVTSKNMRSLQSKKAEVVASMRALQSSAEGREFTAEEQKAYDGHKAKLAGLNGSLEREAELIAEEAALGVATLPDGAVVVEENGEKDGKRGFVTFGHFAKALRQRPGMQGSGYALNGELHLGSGPQAAAPATFGNEAAGPDGGFAVPPDYAKEIFMHSLGEDSLLPMTDSTIVTGNSMVFPKDETTPWGTDGVRAFWQAEAAAANLTKPKLGTSTLRLYKLMGLVPLTDELADDTNALSTYLPKKMGDSIRWKTNEAILFGSGAGQPLGAFNGNAVVTVVKEGGQATLTLLPLNIAKMIARLPAGSYGRAVWLLNNDVLPALWTLNQNNQLVYLPYGAGSGAMQSSPYGQLSGRPVIVSQHAKSFTNQGDVLLLDPQYVRSIQKANGIVIATSMHIYFDADATAFRTTFRVDTQPKIVNPIAPFNGASNLSPFVQLGAR